MAECCKIRYWSRTNALIALVRADETAKRKHRETERRQELRVYRCDICAGRPWHLSSQPA